MSTATAPLTTIPRTEFGSQAAEALRQKGFVPLTINRSGQPNYQVSVDVAAATFLSGRIGHIAEVLVDGKPVKILMKDRQIHPLKDNIIHLDALEVTDDKVISLEVPIRPLIEGCPGLMAGGFVEVMMRKVGIRCKPKDIPDDLPVDLTKAEIGTTIYAGDLRTPNGVAITVGKRVAVVSVVKTRGLKKSEGEEAAAAAAGAEGAAPAAEAGKEGAAKGDAKASAGKEGAKPDAKAAGKEAAKPDAKKK